MASLCLIRSTCGSDLKYMRSRMEIGSRFNVGGRCFSFDQNTSRPSIHQFHTVSYNSYFSHTRQFKHRPISPKTPKTIILRCSAIDLNSDSHPGSNPVSRKPHLLLPFSNPNPHLRLRRHLELPVQRLLHSIISHTVQTPIDWQPRRVRSPRRNLKREIIFYRTHGSVVVGSSCEDRGDVEGCMG